MTWTLQDAKARHTTAVLNIAENFGAAKSSRIDEDKYSIHQDRAALIALVDELAGALKAYSVGFEDTCRFKKIDPENSRTYCLGKAALKKAGM